MKITLLVEKLTDILDIYSCSFIATSFIVDDIYIVTISLVPRSETEELQSIQILNLLTFPVQDSKFLKYSPVTDILDDVAYKIIHQVDTLLSAPQTPLANDWLEVLEHNQESVMNYYRTKFKLGHREEEALHMFFSPGRVVAGLTESEVRLCISLYPIRKQQSLRYPLLAIPMLHESLMENIDKPISRGEGLQKAIEQIFMDLKRPELSVLS